MNSFKKIIFWICLFAFNSLFSQQLRFKHITSENGLSTNYITSIMQDDLGFMWFGTQDGLNKYDGTGQMKIFKNDPTNQSSLSNSEITALMQFRKDLVLVGTRDGLNFFNPITETFSRLQKNDEVPEGKVNVIYKLDSVSALVGMENGLFMVNFANKNLKKRIFSGEKDINVNCIAKVNNMIYVGTNGKGLWRLNKNRLERVEMLISDLFKADTEELLSITHIEQYANKVYLGTYGYGIFKLDSQTFEIESKILLDKNLVNQNEKNYIKDFIIKDNKIYTATRLGIIVYNLISEEINSYTKQESSFALNSNPCNSIFIDSESNFWVGTELGGINVSFFQSLKFPNSTLNYETDFNNIYSIYEESKGVVLLGSSNQEKNVGFLDLKTGQSGDFGHLFKSSAVLSIEEEKDKNIVWLGTWGDGIFRYDKSSKKVLNLLSSQFGGTILCLKISGNNLYAGSVGDGLFKINLDTYEVTSFGVNDGLPNPSINSIFIDTKKHVWLGTYDGGLVKMKSFDVNGKLPIEKIYDNTGKTGQIASNIILSVNEDKNGNIWAATATGLSKLLANNTFYNFYEKDGLPNTYLYAILEDSLHHFWMSSNNGIIRFDPLQKESEITFKNYGVKDGLVNTEYNAGAAFASPYGYMYFGGAKGFNVFRPLAIKDNLHAPSTYIIGYTRGGKSVATDTLITYKKHLKLSWSENFFQFEVVALDYTDPAKNKFRYKLEGYDNDWSAPSSIRYISYSGLPGGEYTLKIKAANNDGIWNEQATEIHVTVIPPFWKTKLFYLLITIIGLGGIYGFTQYRTKAIKKENKILENKVAERTRELHEKNRDITSSIEYAKRIQEAILPSKDHIFKKLRKIFILYQPKDIVSGDFYWFAEKNGTKIFAVVDCTGHGVPGAFMSMIGHNLLHRIVIEKSIVDPAEILNHLHRGIQEALRQGQNEISTNDGMDVSIITIHDEKKEVKWAGANRPLILIAADGSFSKYDGNKFPVGGAQLDAERVFTTHTIEVKTASMAYMFSDGYADQFGGEKGKKFMVKRLHDLLASIHLDDAENQRKVLYDNFKEWRQNHEQVDDVLIVGIEI